MGPDFKPQAAPPPPTIDAARIQGEQADLMRKRSGSASTFVSNAAGQSAGGVATKLIMGQGG